MTGRCLESFRALENLRVLDLGGTALAEEFVQELRHLPKLEKLDLRDTPVTDRILDDLAAIPGLRVCDIDNTSISEEGRARLEKMLEEPDAIE